MLNVTTTYLHLPGPSAFRPALLDLPDIEIIESREPSVEFYRFLYSTTGSQYHWTDRLAWSDDRLLTHLSRPSVTLLPMYFKGTPVGYVELDASPQEPDGSGTEIAYLGIFPAFQGRGYGKHLLSVGVARAFDDGAHRVWLHTCSLDGPYAIANYRARGFLPYRSVSEERPLHHLTQTSEV